MFARMWSEFLNYFIAPATLFLLMLVFLLQSLYGFQRESSEWIKLQGPYRKIYRLEVDRKDKKFSRIQYLN